MKYVNQLTSSVSKNLKINRRKALNSKVTFQTCVFTKRDKYIAKGSHVIRNALEANQQLENELRQ